MSSSVRHSSLSSGTQNEEEARQIFERWMVEKGKSYKNKREKEKRFESFKHNLRFIQKYNSDPRNGTCKLRLTTFADLTWDEFRARYENKILTRDWLDGRDDDLVYSRNYINSDQKSRKLCSGNQEK